MSPSCLRTIILGLSLILSVASVCAAEPRRVDDPHEKDGVAPEHYERPNLLKNGDFEGKMVRDEKTKRLHPEHWEPFKKEGISVADLGKPHKHVLRLDVPKLVAQTTGLFYFSEAIPIQNGTTYDVSLDIRIQAEILKAIVFVKGYAVYKDGAFAGREREIYRHQKHARTQFVEKGAWLRFESHLTPRAPGGEKVRKHRKHKTPVPELIRVEVYTYGDSAGIVEFDNVRVTERPATPEVEAADSATE